MSTPLPAPLPVAKNAHNRHKTEWVHDPCDWYVEEPWCVDLLIDSLGLTGTVLDPACGRGTIVEVCRRRGLDTTGSDLVDRGYPSCVAPVDFTLAGAWPQESFDHVVTNPPYYRSRGTVAFLEAGLRVARRSVSVLAPLPFLASQSRNPWFRGLPISHVLILSQRPSMPPGALLEAGAIRQAGGKEDYVWIVASHGHRGLPVVDWVMDGAPLRVGGGA
jgi:hypothetical protein